MSMDTGVLPGEDGSLPSYLVGIEPTTPGIIPYSEAARKGPSPASQRRARPHRSTVGTSYRSGALPSGQRVDRIAHSGKTATWIGNAYACKH